MERFFGVYCVIEQPLDPAMLFQSPLNHFVTGFQNWEKIQFFVPEMGLYFVFVKPGGIFLQPPHFNIFMKTLSDFPAEQQSKMVLPAKWLHCLMAFNWFFGFQIGRASCRERCWI